MFRKNRGLTLIELLIVIAIFAIILIPAIKNYINKQGYESVLKVERFWFKQDVLNTGTLANSLGGLLIQREVTLYLKPPFYSGQMPLQYKTISKEMGGGMMMSSITIPIVYDFGDWSNLFIYQDIESLFSRMPLGAVAVDSDRNVIAECKVMNILDTNKHLTGFEITEIHYNKDQQAIFTSTFTINDVGFKTNERNTRGKKQKEYFFLWPTSLCY